ncbi:MAG TPA: magnesium-translocating P-type ATPase, partial [Rugosimonospora sp.]|nr:magnesium-translocating P-type ATPase [Rugosimonospora sp.]
GLAAPGQTTTTVLRRSGPGAPPVRREVPTDQLVPGDIVHLAAGDVVPADVRLLRTTDLLVSQAPLTGESLPVLRHARLGAGTDPVEATGGQAGLFDWPSVCLLGGEVVGGSAMGVVLATGAGTRFAALHEEARPREESTFERRVREVSVALLRGMVVAAAVVLLSTGWAYDDWVKAAVFAVSAAVGLIPEMLPLVVTTALVRGSAVLRRRDVIAKHLPAVYNLGAIDVLCTDKTATLTADQVTVRQFVDPAGHPDPDVLAWASVNAEVCAEQAEQAGQPVGDPLDEAVLDRAAELGVDGADRVTGLGAMAFDAVRRRSSVLVRGAEPGVETVVTKGAVEEVLSCCTRVRTRDGEATLDAPERARQDQLTTRLHAEGVRVLAVAVKTRAATGRPLRAADEQAMTLIGYVGMRDEVTEAAVAAVATLRQRDIAVKVITGDHPLVAARLCRDAGVAPGVPVTGAELDTLDDAALGELAERTTVFARVDPRQKARVVAALRARGHTVGYLGDGVNDTSALRAADVGISVASAVGVVRAASDVLLLTPDLAVLAKAVDAGRRTVTNTVKYLKITLASTVGNVCSVVAAGVLLPFLPMLPLQILLQNLLFDASQLCLAFDRADPDPQGGPARLETRDLARFVACFGLVNSLADLATFAALWHVLGGHATPAVQVLFHTGWFVENLLTQALAVHLLRSPRGPRRWSWAAPPVLTTTAAVAAVTVGLPFTPVGGLLGLHPLPAAYYAWLSGVLVAFCAATLAAKSLYRRLTRRWL